jgi:fumarate hydratase subunit beta
MSQEGTPARVALQMPLDATSVASLRAGNHVVLTGPVLAARDAAHQRMHDLLAAGKPLPFALDGETIYYVGPSPAQPGQVIGSAGPTSSYRMDDFTLELLTLGLRAMIGKGRRSHEVVRAIQRHGAVYFGAVGGAGALLARRIRRQEPVAWDDLGAEAVVRLWLDEFPVVVINDSYGGDLYDDVIGPGPADE